MDSRFRDFDDIYLGGKNGVLAQGKFKISEAGVGWKNQATGQIITVSAADLNKVVWSKVARDYQLKISKKDQSVLKFDGFPKEALDGLASILKTYYHISLEQREVSVRGYNWGSVDFDHSNLVFSVAGKHAFDLPLQQVANASLGSKSEVALEFGIPPDSTKKFDHLVEIRFYLPGNATAGQVDENRLIKDKTRLYVDDETNEEGEISAAAQKTVLGPDGELLLYANAFCDTVKYRADLGGAASEAIFDFSELLCLTPRGRFHTLMYPNCLRLRGKSHDYKILYSSIKRLCLVPKPDDLHWLLVVGMDPPLRQGQTRYPHLVFQIAKEEDSELHLNVSEYMNLTQ
jgi:structure-specific recognition protein 1